jgi:hypothetical protein
MIGKRDNRKHAQITRCSVTIINNSNIDADHADFTFHSGEHSVPVHAGPINAFSSLPVSFDWPYPEPWNAASGFVAADPDGQQGWTFPEQSTNEFPDAKAPFD